MSRSASLLLPVVVSLLAVGVANAVLPLANEQVFDSLVRGFTALLVGILLGLGALIIYGRRHSG